MGKPSVHQLFRGSQAFRNGRVVISKDAARLHHYNKTCKAGRLQDNRSRIGAASRKGKVKINQNARYSWRCRICKLQAHAR